MVFFCFEQNVLTAGRVYITIRIRKAYKGKFVYLIGGIYMESREELIEIRKSTGMNRREFAEYFEIPYRTMQDWELGNRKMPEYLLRLMAYKVRMEQLSKGNVEEKGEGKDG